jgi:hypothetical protein
MSQQLSSEAVKCRQMEEKNVALQLHLEDLLGHNYVLVEKQTMTAIQESFSDFQKFIQKLRNVGYDLHISCFLLLLLLLLSHFVLSVECLTMHCVMSVGRPTAKPCNTCNLKKCDFKVWGEWVQAKRIFLSCISDYYQKIVRTCFMLFILCIFLQSPHCELL